MTWTAAATIGAPPVNGTSIATAASDQRYMEIPDASTHDADGAGSSRIASSETSGASTGRFPLPAIPKASRTAFSVWFAVNTRPEAQVAGSVYEAGCERQHQQRPDERMPNAYEGTS